MSSEATEGQIVGRYRLWDEIASGGMATVHLGRLMGPVGFSRTVAIKRLHPQFAKDPEFVAMLVDEARLAARIAHPNIVATVDVVAVAGELLLVMEYVKGESLAKLLRARTAKGERVPPGIVVRVIIDALSGLHAAHEAISEQGEFLGLVHRDVSPQNVLVGVDGVARVVDFGVAKASFRVQNTTHGHVKGKLGYMPPEQLHGDQVDRRADIFAAATIAWEALVGKRLFGSEDSPGMLSRFRRERVCAPSSLADGLARALDDVILRGLAEEPAERFATAREMALALEKAVVPASAMEVGEWVEETARAALVERARLVAAIERQSPADSFDFGATLVAASAAPAPPPRDAPPPPPPPPPAAKAEPQAPPSSTTREPSSAPSSAARKGKIVLAGAVLAIAGIALVFAATRDRSSLRAPAPIASVAPETTTTSSVSASTSTSTMPLASSPPEPSAPPAAVSSTARAAAPQPPSRASAAKASSAAPLKRNCDPPYTIGDRGFRIPKPQCL